MRTKEYEQAVTDAENAIILYPYDGNFYNLLGAAQWQRKQPGDFDSGLRNVQKAVKLCPDKCMFWDNLGKGLYDSGRKLEAREALIRASKCSTTPEKLAEIEKNIQIIDQGLAEKQRGQSKPP